MTYSALGGRPSLCVPLSPAAANELIPDLRADDLRSVGSYIDHETNDARLTIAVALAAERAHAVIATRVEVRAFRTRAGSLVGAECLDLITGSNFGVEARCVVNATGPWVDEVRRIDDPSATPLVRFAKGAHIIVPLKDPWRAALTTPLAGGRVQFANPWEGALLVGTTDHDYHGNLNDVRATEHDVDEIVRESRASIQSGVVEKDRVLSAFAGLRVLPYGHSDTDSVRRATIFDRSASGMLSVAGGKYTTFRRTALETLERLRTDLGLAKIARAPMSVPGAADADVVSARITREYPSLSVETAAHLARFHGSRAIDLLLTTRDDPTLLERITPGALEIAAQVRWAREREWAISADDVLARRTTLAALGHADDARARVEELLG